MLCKHEVVGSIPSVSTIRLGLGAAVAVTFRTLVSRPLSGECVCRSLDAVRTDRSPQGRLLGEDISDIVKRECGRQARESVCPAVMFGKHTVIGSETI